MTARTALLGVGLTLLATAACGTDRTGLDPRGPPVQPDRADVSPDASVTVDAPPGDPLPPPTRLGDGPAAPSCDDGLTSCGLTEAGAPACVNVTDDDDNCGACGRRCPGDQTCVDGACGCSPGQTSCAGLCVNVQSQVAHCGGCGRACLTGQVCSQGRCSLLCDPGMAVCGGACVDLLDDARHCGSCNTTCKGNRPCVRGRCADKGRGMS